MLSGLAGPSWCLCCTVTRSNHCNSEPLKRKGDQTAIVELQQDGPRAELDLGDRPAAHLAADFLISVAGPRGGAFFTYLSNQRSSS